MEGAFCRRGPGRRAVLLHRDREVSPTGKTLIYDLPPQITRHDTVARGPVPRKPTTTPKTDVDFDNDASDAIRLRAKQLRRFSQPYWEKPRKRFGF